MQIRQSEKCNHQKYWSKLTKSDGICLKQVHKHACRNLESWCERSHWPMSQMLLFWCPARTLESKMQKPASEAPSTLFPCAHTYLASNRKWHPDHSLWNISMQSSNNCPYLGSANLIAGTNCKNTHHHCRQFWTQCLCCKSPTPRMVATFCHVPLFLGPSTDISVDELPIQNSISETGQSS